MAMEEDERPRKDGEEGEERGACELAAEQLTEEEYACVEEALRRHHGAAPGAGQCSSVVVQRVRAPVEAVWEVVRRFDRPQAYKHFIRSCEVKEGDGRGVGSVREVSVVSGLPAASSRERLEILDETRHVLGFRVLGGQHRLHNYRSTTSLTPLSGPHPDPGHGHVTLVVESYVVDVPDGNTPSDTRTFVDTVVRCNLQSLAHVSERLSRHAASPPTAAASPPSPAAPE